MRAFPPAFVFTLTATAVVWRVLGSPTSGVDDANIFLAYAQNISGGYGFVFNAGGERVEGFTSLLWVLVCAAAVKLSSNPEAVLVTISIVLLAIAVTACIRSSVITQGRTTSAPWATIFLALLFSDYRFVAWNTITLMDTSVWCCLLTISAALTIDDRLSTAGLRGCLTGITVLMMLARPEAVLLAPLVILLVYLKCLTMTGGQTTAVRVAAPAAIAYLITVGVLTAFRLSYFGFPLPNTFYAKVSPSISFTLHEGGRYFLEYVLSGPIPMLSALALCISTGHLLKVGWRNTRTLALTVLGVAGLLIPVVAGGDHFGGFRFYQAVYPILLLALLNCLRFIIPALVALPAVSQIHRGITLIGTASLLAMFVVAESLEWTAIAQRTRLPNEFDIAEAGRNLGSVASKVFDGLPQRPSIATITVGALKYKYDAQVVDLMGLNDTKMAHNGGARMGLRAHAAFEKRTFYELRPTILVPLVQVKNDIPTLQRRNSFADAALKGLLGDQQFRDRYRLAEVRRKTPSGIVTFAGWYKKAFLETLQRSGKVEVVTAQTED